LLAKDAKCAAVPFLGQIATAAEEAAGVRDYNKAMEAAMKDPGLAFVAVVAEGEDENPAVNILDLWNTVVLSVVENPAQNKTELTAYQYTRRALRVLKGAASVSRGARTEVRLSKPAFNVGPLNKGTTVYFINLLVRTTEDLGAVDPA
jgi:hypothetical protein